MQHRLEGGAAGRVAPGIDRPRQAHDAVHGGQLGLAEQLAGGALDRVAGHRTRRQPLGGDHAQASLGQAVAARIQHEMLGTMHRAQTKNG